MGNYFIQCSPVPGPRVPFIQRAKLCCSTQKYPHLEYITSIESACQKLDYKKLRNLEQTSTEYLECCHSHKPNFTKEELKAFVELGKDSNRIVLTADKGVAIVVMDRKDYIDKATNILSQPAYRNIDRYPTNKLKAKLITLLRKIKRETGLEDYIYKYMYHMGCTSPKFCGLPKIHKTITPFKPIVSSRGQLPMEWVKFLLRYLSP